MSRYVARELDEREATTVLETIGDTPVWGVFDTELEDEDEPGHDRVIAVTPTYGAEGATNLALKLNE